MSLAYRYGKAGPEERTFGMGWHIVVALHRVFVVWLSLFYEMIHYAFHVGSYVGVCILIDGQRT